MIEELIVHIGPPKTATSTIQSWMALNERGLASGGYIYPRAGRFGDSHWTLAQSMAVKAGTSSLAPGEPGPPNVEVLLGDLQNEIKESRMPVVILSSELFIRATAATCQQLIRLVSPERVSVLIGLRPAQTYLTSLWRQALKEGYCHGLSACARGYFFTQEYMGLEALRSAWSTVATEVVAFAADANAPQHLRMSAALQSLLPRAADILPTLEGSVHNAAVTESEAFTMQQYNLTCSDYLALTRAWGASSDDVAAISLALDQFRRLAPSVFWQEQSSDVPRATERVDLRGFMVTAHGLVQRCDAPWTHTSLEAWAWIRERSAATLDVTVEAQPPPANPWRQIVGAIGFAVAQRAGALRGDVDPSPLLPYASALASATWDS